MIPKTLALFHRRPRLVNIVAPTRFTIKLLRSTVAMAFLLACPRQPSMVIEGFIKVEEEIELYYRRIGNGQHAIVIPGGMYLEAQLKQLATPDRTLLLYDMRSLGKSTTDIDPAKICMACELADLETLRRHFGFERLSLIGWTYAGGIAIQYALSYPERVERIVQIGPIPIRRQPHMDKAAVAAIQGDYYALEDERPENMWNFDIPVTSKSSEDADLPNEIPAVEAPVLIIQGLHDALPLDVDKEWLTLLRNAQLLFIPQGGHLLWAEQPGVVFPAIDRFLRKS